MQFAGEENQSHDQLDGKGDTEEQRKRMQNRNRRLFYLYFEETLLF